MNRKLGLKLHGLLGQWSIRECCFYVLLMTGTTSQLLADSLKDLSANKLVKKPKNIQLTTNFWSELGK